MFIFQAQNLNRLTFITKTYIQVIKSVNKESKTSTKHQIRQQTVKYVNLFWRSCLGLLMTQGYIEL